MVATERDECPVCGAALTEAEYELQCHADHWGQSCKTEVSAEDAVKLRNILAEFLNKEKAPTR